MKMILLNLKNMKKVYYKIKQEMFQFLKNSKTYKNKNLLNLQNLRVEVIAKIIIIFNKKMIMNKIKLKFKMMKKFLIILRFKHLLIISLIKVKNQ